MASAPSSEGGPRSRLTPRLAVLRPIASVANKSVVDTREAGTFGGRDGRASVAQRLAQMPLLDDGRRHLFGLDLVLGLLVVRCRGRNDGLDLIVS